MDGTTLCPHCETRFKIIEAQLQAHHGIVRCGTCLQTFDARPNFIPDEPNPQLELPILSEPAESAEKPFTGETFIQEESQPAAKEDESEVGPESISEDGSESTDKIVANSAEPALPESPHSETTDLGQPLSAPNETDTEMPAEPPLPKAVVVQPIKPAQRTTGERRKKARPLPKHHIWPWAFAALLLLLLALAQTAYFFRVEIAVRLPGLKPALISYCQLLNCSVPLPQETDLMSIESSDLEANHAHENLITLNALLRNRAPYPQAFPNLELTLNDTQDKPLARRIFKPSDYLPPVESENVGLLPNHELGIKLHLDTTSLKPSGYRLVLYYPKNN